MDETPFDYLLTRKIAGEMTATEETELQQWLAASPEHHRLFREVEKLWHAAEPLPLPFVADSQSEWLRLTQKLGVDKRKVAARKWQLAEVLIKARRFSTWPRLRPAVAALAAIILMVVAVYLIQNSKEAKAYREIATANAQRVEVTLPDGSLVRLNSASRIRFLPNFSDSLRQVFLDGEAFFQVAKAQRPFVVATAQVEARVLGTAFNVYARDEQARVIVREGRVAVAGVSSTVVVNAGEMTQCRNGENPTVPQAVDVAHSIGWLEGKIVFIQTPLAEVAAELERFYNVPVRLADASLASKTITATFQNQSLASVVSAICLTLDLSYQYKGGKYVIAK